MSEEADVIQIYRKEYKQNLAGTLAFLAYIGASFVIILMAIIESNPPYLFVLIGCIMVMPVAVIAFFHFFTKARENASDLKWTTDPQLKFIAEMMEIIEAARTIASLNLPVTELDIETWSARISGFSDYIDYLREDVIPRIKKSVVFFEDMPDLKVKDVI